MESSQHNWANISETICSTYVNYSISGRTDELFENPEVLEETRVFENSKVFL